MTVDRAVTIARVTRIVRVAKKHRSRWLHRKFRLLRW
jgi:hypothetical protein